MKLIPSLPELLENAVLLEVSPEVYQAKYRNIDAWHTYAARAVMDGQSLLVQLSTFGQNGVEMVSLYHDHNVLWEDAFRWGVRQKNGEEQSGGPTDSVTNQAVTPEALARHKLFQLLSDVNASGDPSFSMGPSRLAGALRNDVVSRIKAPEKRIEVMSRMARAMENLRLQAERLELLAGGKRLAKSLKKEAAMREAQRTQELENEAYARHYGILSNDDLTRIKSQPAHAHLADPSSPLRRHRQHLRPRLR